jgi:hypothetical protein
MKSIYHTKLRVMERFKFFIKVVAVALLAWAIAFVIITLLILSISVTPHSVKIMGF